MSDRTSLVRDLLVRQSQQPVWDDRTWVMPNTDQQWSVYDTCHRHIIRCWISFSSRITSKSCWWYFLFFSILNKQMGNLLYNHQNHLWLVSISRFEIDFFNLDKQSYRTSNTVSPSNKPWCFKRKNEESNPAPSTRSCLGSGPAAWRKPLTL